MKISRFEDLIAWQKAQYLAVLVYDEFKNQKDFGFKDQICRAAVSVSNNIAEGYDRNYTKDFIRFLYISKGSCSEVKSMMYLSDKLNYTNPEKSTEIRNLCEETSKIIYGLIKSLSQPLKN